MQPSEHSRFHRLGRVLRHFGPDLGILAVFSVLSVVVASNQLVAWAGLNGADGLGTGFFGTSVMYACGRGFVNGQARNAPALDAFLKRETETFSRDDLPLDIPITDPDPFVSCHYYLFRLVGITWRLLGISWDVLKNLLVILFAATIAVLYGVFRLGMGRLLSVAGTALFLFSPYVLSEVIYLRDFSKAFFMFATVLIMGRLIKTPLDARRIGLWSALLGFVIGIGLGFRQDLLICLIPAVLVVGLCVRGVERLSFRQRIGALVLLLGSFGLTGSPVLIAMSKLGPTSYHHLVTGFSTQIETGSGVGAASYERMYAGDDPVVHAAYCSYVHRVEGVKEPIRWWSYEAAQAAKRFVRGNMKTFPADMINRGYAATLWNLGVTATPSASFDRGDGSWLSRLSKIHMPFEQHIGRYGLWYVMASFLLMSGASLRLAAGAFLFLLYFCGYTSLQFQMRHCFHLSFVPFWFMGFLLDKPMLALRQLAGPNRGQNLKRFFGLSGILWPALGRMALFAAGAAMILLAPLYVARAIQYHAVGALMEQCAAADLEPLKTEPQPFGDKVMVCPVNRSRALPNGPDLQTDYLVAEFVTDARSFDVLIKYDTDSPGDNFSKPVQVANPRPGVTQVIRYFFPVYEYPAGSAFGKNVFKGIVVPEQYAADFARLYRVTNLDAFRLLPNVTLPADHTLFKWHQTLPRMQLQGGVWDCLLREELR